MGTNQPRGKDGKEKKRKAKKAFLLFLKRLRAVCKAASAADEWLDLMQDLTDLLHEYTNVIPADCYNRIEAAMRPVDATREGMKMPCKVLDHEIEQLVKCLPGGAGAGTAVAAGVVVVALALGAVAAWMQYTAVDINVVNDGCSTIYMPAELPIPIPGVSLPEGGIVSGDEATVSLPRMAFDVDATQPGSISVIVLGLSVPYNLGSEVSSIRFDGVEILGQRVHADLGTQPAHELVIRCR